jgi:hypothetical protein
MSYFKLRIPTYIAAILGLWLTTGLALAQTVHGSVVVLTGDTEEPVPNVKVTLCSVLEHRCHEAVSQNDGEFYFFNISAGDYIVQGRVLSGAVFKSQVSILTGNNEIRLTVPR